MKKSKVFLSGIIKENPIFILFLGMCPVLGTSGSFYSAFGMSICVLLVLLVSNIVISAIRKIVPNEVRIPVYIIIIATIVTVVDMIVSTWLADIYSVLGSFLQLIVVNCIILGRAEMYASKNPVFPSILDGLGMGVGFTAALLCMGIIREVLGSGSIFGIQVLPVQILIFILPPGGFFVFGILIALANKLNTKAGKKVVESPCQGCPMSKTCKSFECAKTDSVNSDKEVAENAG